MERTPDFVVAAEELQATVEHNVREEASLMFKAMEEEIEEMRTFYEKREQALSLTMSNGVRALEAKLAESTALHKAEVAVARAARADRDKLQARVEKQDVLLAEAVAGRAKAQADIAGLQQEVASADFARQELQTELSSVRAAFHETQANSLGAAEQLKSLRDAACELSKLQDSHQKQLHTIQQLEAAAATRAEEVSKAHSDKEAASQVAAEACARAESLSRSAESLAQENQGLKDDSNVLALQLQSVQESAAAAQQEVERLRLQAAVSQSKLEEASRMKLTLDDVREMLRASQQNAVDKANEAVASQAAVQGLEVQMQKLRDELAAKSDETASLTSELDRQRQRAGDADKRSAELDSILVLTKSAVADELAGAKATVQALKNEHDRLVADKAAACDDLDQEKQSTRQAQQRIEELQHTLDFCKARLAEAEKAKAEAEKQVAELTRVSSDTDSHAQESLKRYMAELQQAVAQVEAERIQSHQLLSAKRTTELELQQTKERVSAVMAQLATVQTERDELRQSTQQEISGLTEQNAVLASDLKAAGTKIAQVRTAADVESASLTQRLSAAELRASVLESESKAQATEVQGLRDQLESVRNELSDSRRHQEQLRDEWSSGTCKVARLEAEQEALKAHADAVRNQLSDATSKLRSTTAAKDHAEQRVESLELQVTQMAEEARLKAGTVSGLKAELDSALERAAANRGASDEAQQRIAELKQQYQECLSRVRDSDHTLENAQHVHKHELQAAKAALAAAEASRAAQDSELLELRAVVEDGKVKLRAEEERAASIRAEIATERARADDESREVQALKGVLEDVKVMIAQRDEELAALQLTSQADKQSSSKEASELDELRRQLEEKVKEVQERQSEVVDLKQALSDEIDKRGECQSKELEIQAKMVMMQQQRSIKQLRKELAAARREADCLRACSEDWLALSTKTAEERNTSQHQDVGRAVCSEVVVGCSAASVVTDDRLVLEQPSLLALHDTEITRHTVHDTADVIALIEDVATPPLTSCPPVPSPIPAARASRPKAKSNARPRKAHSENEPPPKRAKKANEPKGGARVKKVR